MNRRQSRGKWYVSLRGTNLSLVKGFIGTREDLDAHLLKHLDEIVKKVRAFDKRFLRHPAYWRADSAKTLLKSAAARSHQKGYHFSLTKEWIERRLEEIGDRCEVSGMKFIYAPAEKAWHRNPHGPSLDRIKRELGYHPDNVRIICTCVNVAINEWSEETFFKMCAAVQKRRENAVQNG